jgi:L,D-transpeptidase catalytic domain
MRIGRCVGRRLAASLVAAALPVLFAASAQAAILVNIDKNTQRMTVAVDGETRYVWPVSTGRPGYETPNGTFKVNRLDADHQSQEWDGAPMPHTMFFDLRGHAIHGFSDVKHLGLPVSHGCVRLAPANAATLFALVQAQGMKEASVVVSGQTPAISSPAIARRAPVEQAAAQPQVPPPGYDGYQPAPPQPYDAQGYDQGYYRQPAPPPNYGQAPQPNYAQPQYGQPQYGQPQYYRVAPPPYGQPQPYYGPPQPGYYPAQPPPAYVLRPYGLY